MSGKNTDLLRRKFDFRWEVLDVIVSGKSSIDSPYGFEFKTIEDVERFLHGYGFDTDNPIEQAEILGNYQEALSFIRKYFLQPDNPDGLKLEMPRKFFEITDVKDVFLMACGRYPRQGTDAQGVLMKNAACAILKVMHTIAHLDKDIRTPYFTDVQKQILDRYYRVIHRDDAGQLYLGEKPDDPLRVNLVSFETKPKKTRDSTLLKMLHKSENVAEEIFDRVGIRFVTQNKLDALRVVKFLKEKRIVIAPNIKPSRSRNTLVDVEAFRTRLAELFAQLEQEGIDEEVFARELSSAIEKPLSEKSNEHSSEFYQSMQFTARQLIKLKNPNYDEWKELRSISKKMENFPEEVKAVLDRVDMKYIQREFRFFYPYEVQIMDQASHEENERGRSSHAEYKKAQLLTAMKRVMGPLASEPAPGNGTVKH